METVAVDPVESVNPPTTVTDPLVDIVPEVVTSPVNVDVLIVMPLAESKSNRSAAVESNVTSYAPQSNTFPFLVAGKVV